MARTKKKDKLSGTLARRGLDKEKTPEQHEQWRRLKDKVDALAGRYYPTLVLEYYLRSLDHPRKYPCPKVPYHGNLAPSLYSTTGYTTCTQSGIVVPSGKLEQLFFPNGHTALEAGDAFANSGPRALVAQPINGVFDDNALLLQPGCSSPVPTNDVPFAYSQIRLGVPGTMTTNQPGVSPGYPSDGGGRLKRWDRNLPYGPVLGVAGSNRDCIRWRLASAEITITVETSNLNAAGDIIVARLHQSLAPVSPGGALPTSQAELKPISSWKRYPMAGKRQVTINFVPTPDDLLYWFDSNGNPTARLDRMVGTFVFINAGSADATYSIDYWANWELAGPALSAITTLQVPSTQDMHTVKMATQVAHGEGIGARVSKIANDIYEAMPSMQGVVHTAKHIKDAYDTYRQMSPMGQEHELFIPHVPN